MLMRVALILTALLFGPAVSAAAAPPDHSNARSGTAASGNGEQSDNAASSGKPDTSNRPSPSDRLGANAPTDQGEALAAVKSGKALPLSRILDIARQDGLGRVINARLVNLRGVVLYELTILDDGGYRRRAYYFARTGLRATVN